MKYRFSTRNKTFQFYALTFRNFFLSIICQFFVNVIHFWSKLLLHISKFYFTLLFKDQWWPLTNCVMYHATYCQSQLQVMIWAVVTVWLHATLPPTAEKGITARCNGSQWCNKPSLWGHCSTYPVCFSGLICVFWGCFIEVDFDKCIASFCKLDWLNIELHIAYFVRFEIVWKIIICIVLKLITFTAE